MFGETELRPEDPIGNVPAFYFQSTISAVLDCEAAPPDGLLVQTPEGVVGVQFHLNNVLIELGSTVFIQAIPDDEMAINVIEGQAIVTANGVTVTVQAGSRTRIPLDSQALPISPPAPPEPYDIPVTRPLPIQLLERPIVIAPPVAAAPVESTATLPATVAVGITETAVVQPVGPVTETPFFAFNHTPVFQNVDNVEMVLVPAGCFIMGTDNDFTRENEQPMHQQCFLEDFWIDRYEVTNVQFEQFGGQAIRSPGGSDPLQPRIDLSWYEMRDFCALRNARLPTEAEWEYAARGPESLIYPWSNEFIGDNVVYFDNSNDEAVAVGSRPTGASWVGAEDLSGNVWEFTSTIYDEELYPYPYQDDDGREDIQQEAELRVMKGGGYYNDTYDLHNSTRAGALAATVGLDSLGFRCARSSL
jgi:formylglycine-generating enzyme required for sulfatase activity